MIIDDDKPLEPARNQLLSITALLLPKILVYPPALLPSNRLGTHLLTGNFTYRQGYASNALYIIKSELNP
jgi:hypothetical protein